MNRRRFIQGVGATAAAMSIPPAVRGAGKSGDLAAVYAEIPKRHDEAVKRLQDWIKQPAIAAEKRGGSEGCDLLIRMLQEAGFGRAEKVPTDGQPGVFATLDAGAPITYGVYFMRMASGDTTSSMMTDSCPGSGSPPGETSRTRARTIGMKTRAKSTASSNARPRRRSASSTSSSAQNR